MATFNKTIVNGLVIDGAQDAIINILDVVAAIANDLDFADGKLLIRVVREGTTTDDPEGGQIITGSEQIDLVRAVREFPSSREIDQSNGKIRVGDRKFHYKVSSASFVPRIGDHIVAQGTEYEVVAVDIQTLGTRYLVYCRA